MRKTLKLLVALTLLATGFAVVGPASPAQAGCPYIVDVGLTKKQLNWIVGEGSYTQCTGYQWIEVTIQRYGGLGIWWDQASATRRETGIRYVYFDCTGMGTQTYRTRVDLWTDDNHRVEKTKYSNEIRVSC